MQDRVDLVQDGGDFSPGWRCRMEAQDGSNQYTAAFQSSMQPALNPTIQAVTEQSVIVVTHLFDVVNLYIESHGVAIYH